MGQGVGGERQTRQVRQASASCGAVGQGVGGERQARQVRQASAGCGAVGQGSGGEGPVRQARQVRQACCGAEGFCLNVSLVSLVSGGPLKVRRACLTCLAQVFWKVRGAGTRQPAELVSLVSMSQGVSLGFGGGATASPPRVSQCLACLAEGPPEGQPADGLSCLACLAGGSSGVRAASDSPPSLSHLSQCLRRVLWGSGGGATASPPRVSQMSRLSRGGVLWGSGGGVRQPAELVSLVSRGVLRAPPSLSQLSHLSQGRPSSGPGTGEGFHTEV